MMEIINDVDINTAVEFSCSTMPISKEKLLSETEVLLAAVKTYDGGRAERMVLMQQLELLYLQLEDPQDSMNRQWNFVSET